MIKTSDRNATRCKLSLTVCLLILLAFSLTPTQAGADDLCRRLRFWGTVSLELINWEPEAGPRKGMVGCLPTGKFAMEVIFADQGGVPLKQNNTVVLTSYRCESKGSSPRCTAEPQPPAYVPLAFKLRAKLFPYGQYREGGRPGQRATDVWQFKLVDPPNKVVVLYMVCDGSGAYQSDLGSAYRQMLMPFFMRGWNMEAPLNKEVSGQETVDLFGKYRATIKYTVFQTSVPCANFAK